MADVIELILDKGLVIDVFVRVSLVGIEILTIDARIVVASVDTFLRFAEATNPRVPQLTRDLVHIRAHLCWSAAWGMVQGPKSPSNTTAPRGWFELRELAFALVAWHSADVMQARTLHDMDSVEDTAIVVADADRGGGHRLPTTVVAALITAAHLGERPATTA